MRSRRGRARCLTAGTRDKDVRVDPCPGRLDRCPLRPDDRLTDRPTASSCPNSERTGERTNGGQQESGFRGCFPSRARMGKSSAASGLFLDTDTPPRCALPPGEDPPGHPWLSCPDPIHGRGSNPTFVSCVPRKTPARNPGTSEPARPLRIASRFASHLESLGARTDWQVGSAPRHANRSLS